MSRIAISSSVTIVNGIGSVRRHLEQERLQHPSQPAAPARPAHVLEEFV
jgi:hypothetical protein